MTPNNISHKSTFIIFIISINIVSMTCLLYQPIEENPISENQTKFTYYKYLKAANQYPNLKKLNVHQYYDSYYNEKYWILPDINKFQNLSSWEEKQTMFCNNEYVTREHFVTTYHIVAFGAHKNDLFSCLKIDCASDFLLLKTCSSPEHTAEETTSDCLKDSERSVVLTTQSLINSEKVTNCFSEFTKKVSELFGKTPDNLQFTNEEVGDKAKIAFNIATNEDNPVPFDDENFQTLLSDYKRFTDDTTYSNDTNQFITECLNIFNKYDEDVFNKLKEKYYVFNEFTNFNEFSKQIKISLRYLEALEGKLINNKELYDEYHENPISRSDYKELKTPLPLVHEEFYPLYFLRLKFLKHIPVGESTWEEQMDELRKSKDDHLRDEKKIAQESTKKTAESVTFQNAEPSTPSPEIIPLTWPRFVFKFNERR